MSAANANFEGGSRPSSLSPTSMSAEILAPLDDLTTLAHTLFLALAPQHTRPPPPPPLEKFLDADSKLAEALRKARTHQRNQQRIETLEAEILELDANLREVWSALEKGRVELDEIIDEGDTRLRAIKKAREGMCSICDK